MSSRWWTCTHDGIGLPGCPTCDGRFPGPRAVKADDASRDVLMLDAARGYLRDARAEIARLTAERDADARILAALRALPPETVADVREASKWERVHALTSLDPTFRAKHHDTAARLTALADALDAAGCPVGRTTTSPDIVKSEADRAINCIGSGGTVTVSRAVLRAMLEQTGGWFHWNGAPLDIKHRHLGVGVYSVWSAPHETPDRFRSKQ